MKIGIDMVEIDRLAWRHDIPLLRSARSVCVNLQRRLGCKIRRRKEYLTFFDRTLMLESPYRTWDDLTVPNRPRQRPGCEEIPFP